METQIVDRPPPRLLTAITALSALVLVVISILAYVSIRDMRTTMTKLVSADYNGNKLVVDTINDNEALNRKTLENVGNRLNLRLDQAVNLFSSGLQVMNESIKNNREVTEESIKTVRELATAKMDSMIVGQDTTTKAVVNGFDELSKQVASFKTSLEKEVKPTKTQGVVARNHLRGWRDGWMDCPINKNGEFYVSPDANKISFYSISEDFEIRKQK